MRQHTIEYGCVEASRDHGGRVSKPDVFVCLVQDETLTPEAPVRGETTIGVCAPDFPHLTASEARQVAAMLTAAVDKLDELQGLNP